MSYIRVGTPKFYIDAMLLARAWGEIETENPDGLHYLNPSNVKTFTLDDDGADYMSIIFKNRYWTNALTHLFVLGHKFYTDNVKISYKVSFISSLPQAFSILLLSLQTEVSKCSFIKYLLSRASLNLILLITSFLVFLV